MTQMSQMRAVRRVASSDGDERETKDGLRCAEYAVGTYPPRASLASSRAFTAGHSESRML